MKKKGLFIWLFVLCAGLPVWGQTDVWNDAYPMAQQPELQQTGYEFEAMPAAFAEEHSIPFAAEDLDGLNETMAGPRKAPPVIGGGEEPPATPDFTPIGDVPMLFMLLLAGVCAVVIRVRTRGNRDIPN